MDPVTFNIEAVDLFERDLPFRIPFRFGLITLTDCTQIFARVTICTETGRQATGCSSEMLVPKWFDKDPDKTHHQNIADLRESVQLAASLYTQHSAINTAYGFFADNYRAQIDRGRSQQLNSLVSCYGPALLDRAILDALCGLQNCGILQAIRHNLPGIVPQELCSELYDFDMEAFLKARTLQPTLSARHTVGLVDAITEDDLQEGDDPQDGLPVTLEQDIAYYKLRFFKVKVGGDLCGDLERLNKIAAVLDARCQEYCVTLDGNEQYESFDAFLALWQAIENDPKLDRFRASIMFIEQPVTRKNALSCVIDTNTSLPGVIIDESDYDLDAFVAAKEIGYSGISSKSCKGFYKSLINAARCELWNRQESNDRYFISAEDLTVQPGIGVQQDLVLASLAGAQHIERNGHHYVNGMVAAPLQEQQAFLRAHPDLYHNNFGTLRLKIEQGNISLNSLNCVGFASGVMPDFTSMRKLG